VEVAEYAFTNRLIDEPAFAWWAPHNLKKKTRLVKLSKSRHIRKGYKFGIRVPNSIEEAIALDIENGNTLWQDAIMKEANGVRIAFEVKNDGKPPPGFSHVQLMMIFDIKMDFTRKARLVARGDLTNTPPALTYLLRCSMLRVRPRYTFLDKPINSCL
jgi:hypothetical protein